MARSGSEPWRGLVSQSLNHGIIAGMVWCLRVRTMAWFGVSGSEPRHGFMQVPNHGMVWCLRIRTMAWFGVSGCEPWHGLMSKN
jgi:hypothetical protein